MQSFDGFDHLGHDLTGSVGPYSAPTGYTQVGSIGYDNPPHMYTVGVRSQSSLPFVDSRSTEGPCRATRGPESMPT